MLNKMKTLLVLLIISMLFSGCGIISKEENCVVIELQGDKATLDGEDIEEFDEEGDEE